MGNPVVHFEIIGKDPIALQAFYKKAFDWQLGEPMAQINNYALAQPHPTVGIAGGIGGGFGDYAGHVTFYVAVADLEAALERIGQLGGKLLRPIDTVPTGDRIALFADPEGHVVGLVEPADDAQSARLRTIADQRTSP